MSLWSLPSAINASYGPISELPPPVPFECIIKNNLHWLYSLPSLVLSIYLVLRLVFLMKAQKDYRTYFYGFLLQELIFAIHSFVVDVVVDRIPQTGLFNDFLIHHDPKALIQIYFFLWYYGKNVVYCSSFILSFIRMLNVIESNVPRRYSNAVIIALLITSYVFPLLSTWFLFIKEVHFYYQEKDPCPVIIFGSLTVIPGLNQNVLSLIFTSVLLIGATASIAITLYSLRKQSRQIHSKQKLPLVRKAERSLTIIATTTFFSLLQNIIFQIIFIVSGTNNFWFSLNKVAWDIQAFSNAWILALTHPGLRVKTFVASIQSGIRPSGGSVRPSARE